MEAITLHRVEALHHRTNNPDESVFISTDSQIRPQQWANLYHVSLNDDISSSCLYYYIAVDVKHHKLLGIYQMQPKKAYTRYSLYATEEISLYDVPGKVKKFIEKWALRQQLELPALAYV